MFFENIKGKGENTCNQGVHGFKLALTHLWKRGKCILSFSRNVFCPPPPKKKNNNNK